MSAAKRQARAIARRFDRLHARVQGVVLNRCVRRSKYRIDCGFSADGRTPNAETTCAVTVIVRGEGSVAAARIRHSCRTEQVLSFQWAREAMEPEAERIAEKPAKMMRLERHSRITIFGQAT